ncbi:MAG: YafY family transcriptional regulator [Anaerolineae bacterium]|nr:YafY family transcriptional regulator [Anaerolineae bacterium]
MYHPTSRVLAVLELLQSHQRITGAELAQRLEVNIRTLRKYITILQDLGIPIIAERGRNGAYELDRRYRLPPLIFTNDEALALEMGLIVADQLGIKHQAAAVDSARSKLEWALPPDLKTYMNTLKSAIDLDLRSIPTRTASHILFMMSVAIHNSCLVRLRYHSHDGKKSEREFAPYKMACIRGLWYVVGWCNLRQAMRTFRLDRISDMTMTDIPFEPPEAFDVLAYVEQAIALLPRDFTFVILLKTTMLEAQARIPTVFGTLEEQNDYIHFQGNTDDLPWLARLLAGLPFEFIIQEPLELQTALREHAKKLIEMSTTPV